MIMILPRATTAQLLLVLAVFVGMLFLAVIIELMRQRRQRRLRIEAAWRTVDEITREKELTAEEKEALRALIQRWAPEDPLRVITVRQQFEKCVEAHMAALRAGGDDTELARAGVLLRDIRVALSLDYIPVGQRIASTRELHVGQLIWLTVASDTQPRWFRGRVASVDEAFFGVVVENGENRSKPEVREGDEMRGRTWRDDDARYMFTVVYARRETEPPALVFHHTSELERLQSRAHFRVRHEQTATVSVLSRPVDGALGDLEERRVVTRVRARVTNLSAGGCALLVQHPLPTQVLLRIPLELGDLEPLEVTAEIVAMAPIAGGRNLVRTTFVAVSDETRDMIARYVIRQQQPALHPAETRE